VYAVLSLVSSISAYTSGEYLRAGLSEEASRAKIAAARENEKAQDLSELVDSIHQQVNDFRRAQGLQPLRLEPIISAQARQHNLEMAHKGSAISHKGLRIGLKNQRETSLSSWRGKRRG
jgi:uncharacterized protein YkwD